jgi:hypothetical protein
MRMHPSLQLTIVVRFSSYFANAREFNGDWSTVGDTASTTHIQCVLIQVYLISPTE